MRILIYWEQESWGGVDSHLLELLTTWPVASDQFVLCYNQGNQGFERIRSELECIPNVRCVEVVSCSHNALSKRFREQAVIAWTRHILYFLQPLSFLLMTRRLRKIFEREGPFDILLSDNGAYPAAWGCLCALFAARQADIPARVLLVHHAATSPALFMGWFEALIDRWVSRVASMLICVSDATRSTLLNKRRINDEEVCIRVVHNGVSSQSTVETHNVPFFDVRAVIDNDTDLLIGIVGRVQPYKGHEDILFALARMSGAVSKRVRFVIAGGGEKSELDRLGRIAARLGLDGRVHLLGYVPGRSMDLIKQLDLLIVATRSFEGFGLTLVEAMKVGTPLLATSVGAIPEFIDSNVGRLIPPSSPGALAEALTDFVEHHEDWLLRAKVALKKSERSGKSMAEEYHRLFTECIASAKV